MRKIVTFTHVTLDGVMQAPADPNEDRRGGFEHGGWESRYMDRAMGEAIQQSMSGSDALMFGRKTYQHMYAVWPGRTDNPYTEVLNDTRKYVASRTLQEPLPWENSTLLRGDLGAAVRRVKEEPGSDVVVLGSGELVQALMQRDLVDEYLLLIHPLVLGSGRRLFPDGGAFARLVLADSMTTPSGVVIATYRRDAERA